MSTPPPFSKNIISFYPENRLLVKLSTPSLSFESNNICLPGRVNAEANASAVSATKRAVTSPQVAVFKDIVIFQRIVGLQPRKITGNSSNAGLYRAIALLTCCSYKSKNQKSE